MQCRTELSCGATQDIRRRATRASRVTRCPGCHQACPCTACLPGCRCMGCTCLECRQCIRRTTRRRRWVVRGRRCRVTPPCTGIPAACHPAACLPARRARALRPRLQGRSSRTSVRARSTLGRSQRALMTRRCTNCSAAAARWSSGSARSTPRAASPRASASATSPRARPCSVRCVA